QVRSRGGARDRTEGGEARAASESLEGLDGSMLPSDDRLMAGRVDHHACLAHAPVPDELDPFSALAPPADRAAVQDHGAELRRTVRDRVIEEGTLDVVGVRKAAVERAREI